MGTALNTLGKESTASKPRLPPSMDPWQSLVVERAGAVGSRRSQSMPREVTAAMTRVPPLRKGESWAHRRQQIRFEENSDW
jgi:hypothetical protein